MLTVSKVSKSYGRILAVENLSFTVGQGEVLGLLGANGAGKSTTMNMLSGYFSPGSGRIVLDQTDSRTNSLEFSGKIGYLPEIPPLYPDMKVSEQLRLVGRIKGVSKPNLENELQRVAGFTQIGEMLERRNRALSKGYKQRVGLAQALIGSPQLLILDEPTAGLDPRQIIEFRNLPAPTVFRNCLLL